MRELYLKFFLVLCLLANPLFALSKYSIVFIHIGPTIPKYVPTALTQARSFNENCVIILLANQNALDDFKDKFSGIKYVPIPCESLSLSEEHKEFLKNSSLRDGFWKYTSERFLYLDDLMAQYDLKNVFHLEYDNMLYVNLGDILPIFEENYPGIGATFDNDNRCIPGFVYVRNQTAMKGLAKCFAKYAKDGLNDMEMLARYKNQTGNEQINNLPIIMREYIDKNTLRSPSGHTVSNKNVYGNNYEKFSSIFDAAALGQYLGGIDPIHGSSKPGFINESCVFNPSVLRFEWYVDNKDRKVPYAIYGETICRINNLHIHSKRLEEFLSSTSPKPLYQWMAAEKFNVLAEDLLGSFGLIQNQIAIQE